MRDEEAVKTAVISLLDALKIPQEDRERLLQKTPYRAAEALLKSTEGYFQDPSAVLTESTDCTGPYRVSVPSVMLQTVKSLATSSYCGLHFAPMGIIARIAYIPAHLPGGDRRTVPVGNMARLVKMYARRLTTPEIIARSVCEAIIANLDAQGVMVRLSVRHHCPCGKNQFDDGMTLYCLGTLSTNSPMYGAALASVSGR